MLPGFTMVPKKLPASKAASPAAALQGWFGSIQGVSPETLARLREQVQKKMEAGVCRHLLPKVSAKHLIGVELQRCVECVVSEQWDTLLPEERLLVRFPTVNAIGEYFDIPNRGRGLIIRRELTRRFGVEMVFQMHDGSFLKWEFID